MLLVIYTVYVYNTNNMRFFKKFKTKIFIFDYYPKMPLEMNSTHPFYPILIPNASYVKNFILFVGGPQGVPELNKNLMMSKNYFN